MSYRQVFILKVLGGLVVLWGVVYGVVKVSGAFEVTPEKIIALVESGPLEGVTDSEEREEVIRDLAEKINRLDFAQRREFRKASDTEMRAFAESLSPEETELLIRLTIDSHFKAVMEAFNEMEPDERRRMVKKIQADMEKDVDRAEERERLEEIGEDLFETVVESGMRSFYKDASAEVKMDLAPLLEDIQARMEGRVRHGPR